jgi:hypothetical protein
LFRATPSYSLSRCVVHLRDGTLADVHWSGVTGVHHVEAIVGSHCCNARTWAGHACHPREGIRMGPDTKSDKDVADYRGAEDNVRTDRV